MSPKRIDKEERKKQIALGALDLFAEKGLEGTSISEVAKQAGIGKGGIPSGSQQFDFGLQ